MYRSSKGRTRAMRWLWLVAALIAFLIAAWLMRVPPAEKKQSLADRGKVHIPTHMTPNDAERLTKRRRQITVKPAAPEEEPQVVNRDPVLAALPSLEKGRATVVFEANAIRHSALGDKLIACFGKEGRRAMEEIRDKAGVDVLEDLDRVAVAEDLVIVSGSFEQLRLDQLEDMPPPVKYGENAQIIQRSEFETIGVWNNELVIFGDRAEEVQQAIDRLEGRAPAASAINDGQAFGEVYGALSPEIIREMLASSPAAELGERIAQVASQIEVHADVRSDVGLVLEARGASESEMNDLAKAIGGALAMGRLAAAQEGEGDWVELLDLASVSPSGDNFTLELALPAQVLEKYLARCPGARESGSSVEPPPEGQQ